MPARNPKLRPPARLARTLARLRAQGKKIVFTNGCFDLLHPGHVRLLRQAKKLGDVLVVALNDDASVRRLKGKGRPILPLRDRCEVLSALEAVDYVTFFSEDTPERLVRLFAPDVLVKGADWRGKEIAGASYVRKAGGRVRLLPYRSGYSSSDLVRKIREARV
ncbi:MAG: glycerol-3-phosphate cytidylyltransferase [Candidatus Binatia bacterium]|nr:MAG: glycerol-3-phosphate cytidylyltransferase [Candidatus Binatia bacterium]